MGLVHRDDVEAVRIDRGDLQGLRYRLGEAAGTERLGLSRYVLEPGRRAMPVHQHADEEEIFVVLAGSGFSVEDDEAYAIGAGDAMLYPAGGRAHTVVAGDEQLDVLAFGTGSRSGLTWLPRAKAMWVAPRWLPLDGPNPFRLEVEAGPLELPPVSARRPPTIAAIADLGTRVRRRGDVVQVSRDFGNAAGSVLGGMSEMTIDPGARSNPPHCHSAEEELFVITLGDGELELIDREGAVTTEPVRAGHVISRPAGTAVAHSFIAGDGGMTLLAFSECNDADACFYPRSQKVSIRGLGAVFRIERADYWEGEE